MIWGRGYPMKTKILISVLLLAVALPASAEFRTVQRAYEVNLAEMRLPQNEAGTISYKSCNSCEFQTTRVNADTSWILNGRSVSLVKFREGVAAAEDRSKATVTVLHHLEKDRITKVTVTLR